MELQAQRVWNLGAVGLFQGVVLEHAKISHVAHPLFELRLQKLGGNAAEPNQVRLLFQTD